MMGKGQRQRAEREETRNKNKKTQLKQKRREAKQKEAKQKHLQQTHQANGPKNKGTEPSHHYCNSQKCRPTAPKCCYTRNATWTVEMYPPSVLDRKSANPKAIDRVAEFCSASVTYVNQDDMTGARQAKTKKA